MPRACINKKAVVRQFVCEITHTGTSRFRPNDLGFTECGNVIGGTIMRCAGGGSSKERCISCCAGASSRSKIGTTRNHSITSSARARSVEVARRPAP